MKKINLILLASVLSLGTFLQAQEIVKEEFIPSGKPFVKIHSNFHTNLSNNSGFDISRAYFGYKYGMSENFSSHITLDVGDSKNGSSLERTAYLKTAAIVYKKGKITADFGLIGLKQFKIQEKAWGHRYLYKSLQDEHKFGSSADMGASLTYKLHDKLSIDATIMNGEGYKKLQADDTYKGGLGMTILPVDNLTARLYYDISPKPLVTQSSLATFVGYKIKNMLSVGAEYNMQQNSGFGKNQTLTGVSVYASYDISDKYQVFGRFDQVSSNTLANQTADWHLAKDGSVIIGGVQCIPVEGVKAAVSFQGWQPAASGVDMQALMYLNFEYKF